MAESRVPDSHVGNGDGLVRAIGPRLLLLFIVGDMLGTGIYVRVGEVAGEVGGAVWVAFLVAFILAALTACAYAELVGKYPRAAGAALYANRAFRSPFFSFMVAFAVVCSGLASASAAALAFGGDYLSVFVSLPSLPVAVLFGASTAFYALVGFEDSVNVAEETENPSRTFPRALFGGILITGVVYLL